MTLSVNMKLASKSNSTQSGQWSSMCFNFYQNSQKFRSFSCNQLNLMNFMRFFYYFRISILRMFWSNTENAWNERASNKIWAKSNLPAIWLYSLYKKKYIDAEIPTQVHIHALTHTHNLNVGWCCDNNFDTITFQSGLTVQIRFRLQNFFIAFFTNKIGFNSFYFSISNDFLCKWIKFENFF